MRLLACMLFQWQGVAIHLLAMGKVKLDFHHANISY